MMYWLSKKQTNICNTELKTIKTSLYKKFEQRDVISNVEFSKSGTIHTCTSGFPTTNFKKSLFKKTN